MLPKSCDVAIIGAGVIGWTVGDAVCALTPGGSYAEYCAVPAPQCLPPPKGFDMLHAAALPENYFTVWHNLFERGQLAAGESVLIHGGASGIEISADEVAPLLGVELLRQRRRAHQVAEQHRAHPTHVDALRQHQRSVLFQRRHRRQQERAHVRRRDPRPLRGGAARARRDGDRADAARRIDALANIFLPAN